MFELRLSGKVDLAVMSAVGAGEEMGLGATLHFHASPKGVGVLVVPCVDDASADMFSFGSGLLCRGVRQAGKT